MSEWLSCSFEIKCLNCGNSEEKAAVHPNGKFWFTYIHECENDYERKS